jgi:heparan-alpha-glucosaminide N-acetyltransferase
LTGDQEVIILQSAIETTPSPSAPVSPQEARIAPVARNVSIDAYRGLVMLLMMAEVLRLAHVARSFPESWFWAILAFNQSHVEWAGCSLHDLIQPSFSFLVGVALPYSIASRLAKGKTFGQLMGHAVWRSLLLIWLGIFLRSLSSTQTNFTFEDTLTQIGLGYPILFLLGFKPPRWQWIALGIILFGYWLAWALYPTPGPGFDYQAVGVPAGWTHNFTGFASHWNKNSNLGAAFDQWFLNLFPRSQPFIANRGGYLTLSFIPTLGTMILGLVAGRWLRDAAPRIPMRRLLIAGIIGIAAGALFHFTGICPIVKRIWTPSWTLFSGGICFLFLAVFGWIIDIKGYRRWAFPLVVIGMNSIAAYLIAHLFEEFIVRSFHTHLSPNVFKLLGGALEPLVAGIAVLSVYWLILLWMYRRKLFLKV